MVDLIEKSFFWIVANTRRYNFIAALSILSILAATIFSAKPLSAASANQESDAAALRLIEIETPIKAPDFTLNDIEGKAVRLASLKNSPLMLYFWASW